MLGGLGFRVEPLEGSPGSSGPCGVGLLPKANTGMEKQSCEGGSVRDTMRV